MGLGGDCCLLSDGMGLSSTDMGLKLLYGATGNENLTFHSEGQEGSLWLFQPICGTGCLWDGHLKSKHTRAIIWAPLKEQSSSCRLQGHGETRLWLCAGEQCCIPWEGHREHCFEFLLFLLNFKQSKLIFPLGHCVFFCSAAVGTGDWFCKPNFPWTSPSSRFTLPAARLGFKTARTKAENI